MYWIFATKITQPIPKTYHNYPNSGASKIQIPRLTLTPANFHFPFHNLFIFHFSFFSFPISFFLFPIFSFFILLFPSFSFFRSFHATILFLLFQLRNFKSPSISTNINNTIQLTSYREDKGNHLIL